MSSPFVLVIEDDKNLSMIFAEAMKTAGFETEIVPDGKLALERLAVTRPSLVLLDLHLPKVSGREILRQIRDDDRLTETQIILTTADALMADSLRDEADLVLLKPISFNQLQTLARRLHLGDQ